MPSPQTIVSGSIMGQAEAALAASNQPKDKSTLGKDDFLKLLTAQLEHQDPLNPMEDTEFTAQMAQFSSLEQLTNINEGIGTLVNAQSGSQMSTAVSFIGKDVRADGYALSKDSDKISTVYYNLGESVSNAYLNIYTNDGELVRTVDLGSRAPGEYEYKWDGKNWGGDEVADGQYNVAISANNMDGKPVMVKTEVSGEVAGVVFENGQYYLRLADDRYINFLNVNEVVSASSTDNNDGDNSDGDNSDGDNSDGDNSDGGDSA